MRRFNIALLPSDPAVQKQFGELARKFFSAAEDGYLLGEDSLVHITLCQFYANTDREVADLYKRYEGKGSKVLRLTKFRLRPGDQNHAGKIWAEFLIDPVADLLEMQRGCFQHLSRNGIEPITKVETYSPHITLARLSRSPAQVPSLDEVPELRMEFQPAVGISTENGVLVHTL